MRVGIYTITHGRLDYTKRAFDSLKRKAGCNYDHYVWDNASGDGTAEWLAKQDLKHLTASPTNVGQHVSANRLLDEMRKHDYDYIVRFDNDCFVKSKRILSKMVACSQKLEDTAILSPHITGLNSQPERFATKDGDHKLGFVEILGGICRLHPTKLIKDFWFDVRQPMGFGEASQMARYCKGVGIGMAYIENLFVSHGVSTQHQEDADPDYFKAHICYQRYPYAPACS